jgi:hypothetical protein
LRSSEAVLIDSPPEALIPKARSQPSDHPETVILEKLSQG